MGIVVVQSAKITMKTFVALSALAAPAAEADAQLLAAGYTGLAGVGLAGVGLAGVAPYAAGVLPAATVEAKYAAAPAVAPAATLAYAAAPAVHAVAAPAVAYAAAPVATVHHTVHQPIVPVHTVKEQVITAPVVRHVGTKVHHQVHHIPQVHVDTKTSHAVSTHIINHPPQIGAFVAPGLVAAAPAIVAAAPAVEAAAPAEEAAVEAA